MSIQEAAGTVLEKQGISGDWSRDLPPEVVNWTSPSELQGVMLDRLTSSPESSSVTELLVEVSGIYPHVPAEEIEGAFSSLERLDFVSLSGDTVRLKGDPVN